MSTEQTADTRREILAERAGWEQIFAEYARTPVSSAPADQGQRRAAIAGEHRTDWIDRLFEGLELAATSGGSIVISKQGTEIHQVAIEQLPSHAVIGRHPDCHIQLEAYKLALFHAVLHKRDGRLYLESIESESGTLLNRRKIATGRPVALGNDSLVDVPGYQLRFRLPDAPAEEGAATEGMELAEIPSYFYIPPPPPPSPVLTHLVEDRGKIGLWSEAVTTLDVADIIEETHDVKTFRLVGEKPLLFSYRPGQFVTLLLNIDGREVERSYSISSSPSRPHVLELTVKRVPGGLVSNWLCDTVKLGQRIVIKGPAGKFSCFDYPASKMLFLGAGSGITPLISMSRWITDTGAGVDVTFLACFKSPPDIIFRKELEFLSARSNNRFRVAITLSDDAGGRTESWTGFTGRISESLIRLMAPDLDQRHVFLCGPDAFAAEARRILDELGFDRARLHSESFGGVRVARGIKGEPKALQLSEPRHRVHFKKSNKIVETDEVVTLLQLGEAHGIEMDYACRVGSCAECEIAFSGRVSEKPEFEAARIKETGHAYACCSVALSDLEIEA